MGNASRNERGQVLIIIAFAIIGLVAMTGLAVDTGLTFSDRRHAQNAADTAAIAGAMALIQESGNGNVNHDPGGGKDGYYAHVVVAARDLAEQNGYDGDLISNEVEVWTCEMPDSSCGFYAGDPEYVQVIIHSNLNTFFARVIGITQMHNTVQAVALADDDDSGPLYGGKSIIALSAECQAPDNFIVQGTPNLTVTGGGLFINTTDSSCGFKCDTNGGSITADITTAGGDIDTSSKCGSAIKGTQTEGGVAAWEFPVELDDLGIDVPSQCSGPLGTYQNFPGGYTYGSYPSIPGPVTVLTPGSYSDFPPKKEQPLGSLYDRIYMQPGVYCVNNMVKLTTDQLELYGFDVTFFIRAGYAFDLNGGVIQIDAPQTGAYAGYLMIVEPDYDSTPTNCTINGNTSNIFEGAIFAPYCNLTINGGSEPTGLDSQIIAYTITLTGSSTIDLTYDAELNPVLPEGPQTGIVK